ncbi:MAG: GNAT family N-acetyltransferase [Christensenellales bacterium]|jgi:predicted acetyltransferase
MLQQKRVFSFRKLFNKLLPVNKQEIYLALKNEIPEEKDLGIRHTFVYNIRVRNRAVIYTAGYISLRIGESSPLYYLGHIGYRIDRLHQGHGYAKKAVELIKPKARIMGIKSLSITCDVDNIASRKTCENAGCILEQIVDVPPAYREICMGSTKKCRYILFTEEEH